MQLQSIFIENLSCQHLCGVFGICFKMAYRKLSDVELEEKLVELQNVMKMREDLPQNVGE